MKIITTETINGTKRVPVYHYTEIPYTQLMLAATESKSRGKHGTSYLEIPCAFDIETTNIYERIKQGKNKGRINPDVKPFAYMYHWQLCIGYRVVFGRTWKEFQSMLDAIEKNMNLSKKLRLVIYVHNLSFEFQFMRHFLHVTDSFCKAERSPLKIVHNNCIEFRCSAALSNMSLAMFCKNENATFYKMVDQYDYSKIRTSETELTETEQGYCYNDVRGLCECIHSLMRYDTLATIPLTSTGYVRRDARIAVKKNKKNRRIFTDSALSPEEYSYLRYAFRGGDTHANVKYANQILKNVTSYDIASSYPACMVSNKFPMTKFIPIHMETFKRLRKTGEYCFLLHVALYDIAFTAAHGIPYIPLAKTKHITNDRILDNGRIRAAKQLTIWLSDIDMDIIKNDYSIGEMAINEIYMSRLDYLPTEYRNVVLDYYRKKTTLKGLNDEESLYMYGKSKNRLNALYGMMVMKLDQSLTLYTGKSENGYETTVEPLEKTLESYYKKRNNFLAYQWGVWVTVHSRKRLHDMMDIIGDDLIYIDTDSVKFLNVKNHEKDIENLNNKLQSEAEKSGAYADDRDGKRHYMGVFEYDGHYDQFKTLGAKKYVVNMDGKCYTTIAGVNKSAGQKHFERRGIEGFKIGETIENSGHLVAYYNDDEVHDITVNGVTMQTASNLALIDDTYTIGVTDDYMALLGFFDGIKKHQEKDEN